MPRPITTKDLKDLKNGYGTKRFEFITDPDLGIVVKDKDREDSHPWAYQCYRGSIEEGMMLKWITDKSFKRRKKLGHPKPRKKPVRLIMREPDITLDEMSLAMEIMEGLK